MKFIAILMLAFPVWGQVVYSSRVYQTSGRTWIELWEVNVATGARRQLTSSERANLRPRCVARGVEFESGSEPVEPAPPVADQRWLWSRATGQEKLLGKPVAPAPNRRKSAHFTAGGKTVVVLALPSKKELMRVAAPARSEHWDIPIGTSLSPDGTRLVIEGQAGSSTAHYLDLWLLNAKTRTWEYLDGGNDPAWSADSMRLFYTTPRELASLPGGKHQVWVTELRMITFPAGKKKTLVSGLSYNASPTWCGR